MCLPSLMCGNCIVLLSRAQPKYQNKVQFTIISTMILDSLSLLSMAAWYSCSIQMPRPPMVIFEDPYWFCSSNFLEMGVMMIKQFHKACTAKVEHNLRNVILPLRQVSCHFPLFLKYGWLSCFIEFYKTVSFYVPQNIPQNMESR